jgi:hypothetical protein
MAASRVMPGVASNVMPEGMMVRVLIFFLQ